MAFLDQLAAWLLGLQRTVYAGLGARIQGMTDSADAAVAAFGFAFVLGMVHAMTPGHGKVVVFSYFLGARSNPWGGVSMALKIAGTHVVSALALVALFGSAASMFGRPSGVAKWVQIASYGLIVLVGIWLSYRSIGELRRRAPAAEVHAHDRSRGILPFAVGLLPCPMTMLIMTYALANATLVAGLVLTGILGIGIALTIAVVGTVGILVRRGVFARIDPAGRGYAAAINGLQIASSAAIVLLGAVFLLGSLN